MQVRQEVENALGMARASLTALEREVSGSPLERSLVDTIGGIDSRHRRLTSLSEMPMRTTEAQEIQQSIVAIEHDMRTGSEHLRRSIRADGDGTIEADDASGYVHG